MTHICHDPNCHDPHCDGHHHDHTHEGPEHAGLFAERRSYAPAAPVATAQLEMAARKAFALVADSCCIDGILPGHAKALLEADGGALALSMTTADCLDRTPLQNWDALPPICACTITLNVHLIGASVDGDALFVPFDALCGAPADIS